MASGFEHFYGFLGGETDQWYPTLTSGTERAEPWGTPEEGYHFTEDMTAKAIAWVRQLHDVHQRGHVPLGGGQWRQPSYDDRWVGSADGDTR